MLKSDIIYNITTSENKKQYDLYFLDNTTNIYIYIKSFNKDIKIKDIYNYILSVWDAKKYKIKLKIDL